MKIQFNLTPLSYKNKKYKIHHVRSNDYQADFLLLAINEKKSQELLIPCDKFILEQIPFFKELLDKPDNWIEKASFLNNCEICKNFFVKSGRRRRSDACPTGPDDGNATGDKNDNELFDWDDRKILKVKLPDERTILTMKLHVLKPIFFANFLKSIYTQDLPLNKANCVEYFEIMNDLKISEYADKAKSFIKKNIDQDISVRLMVDDDLCKIFEHEIEKFLTNTSVENLKSHYPRSVMVKLLKITCTSKNAKPAQTLKYLH